MLDLSVSTVMKRRCGTEGLTHVRRGNGLKQRVSFILEEVVALKDEWITAALVAERKQALPSPPRRLRSIIPEEFRRRAA